MRRYAYLLAAALLTVTVGSLAQTSNVGGQASRMRLTSLGVGNAAPAGSGNITASGTVTAADYVGDVGGVAPSDFARLSQQNTFTAIRTFVSNAAGGRFLIEDSDAGTNEKRWELRSDAGVFCLRAQQDNDASGLNALCLDRTGTTTDSIALTSTAFTWNGNTLFTTANDGAGSGLDADTVDGLTPTFETSGNFTASFDSACTTTPTITFGYVRVGNIVTLRVKSVSGWPCTSDTTALATTATPVPAAIRPIANPAYSAILSGCLDNGVGTPCLLSVSSLGNVGFTRVTTNWEAGTWTASGNKRGAVDPVGQTVTYFLTDP
jgi:hypothetical protein